MDEIKELLANTNPKRLVWIHEKFMEFKKECYSNEQTALLAIIIRLTNDEMQKRPDTIEL